MTTRTEHLTVLPRRARPLLWLVAGLARIPWHDIEMLYSFWDLLTLTRLAVAFTISGYAWCVWPDADGAQPLHVAVHRSIAKFTKFENEEMANEYGKFVHWAKAQMVERAKPDMTTPGGIARTEILRALGDLLKLPAVTALLPPEAKRGT